MPSLRGSVLGLVLTITVLLVVPAVVSGGRGARALWAGSDGRPSTSKLQFCIWTGVAMFDYILVYYE